MQTEVTLRSIDWKSLLSFLTLSTTRSWTESFFPGPRRELSAEGKQKVEQAKFPPIKLSSQKETSVASCFRIGRVGHDKLQQGWDGEGGALYRRRGAKRGKV